MRILIVALCVVGLAVSASASTTTSSSTSTSTSSTLPPAMSGHFNVQPVPLQVPELRVTGQTYGVAAVSEIHFCGQLVDGSSNAEPSYLGHDSGFTSGYGSVAAGGTVCDALDSATETTADTPLATGAFSYQVLAMRCHLSSDPTGNVVFTARSAAANLSPSLTCTVPGAGATQDCYVRSTIPAPTLAATDTIAVEAMVNEDLQAQDASCWWTIALTS